METTENLLQVIKNKIKERGLTLTEIADKLETTHTSISRILNGINRLSTEDLAQFSNILGIPMSMLLKEAEQKDGKQHISEELEKFICGDSRVYSIFVALNTPTTIEALSARLSIKKDFIQKTIDRFKKERIVFLPGPGLYQVTDFAKDIFLGKTKEFYALKSEVYEAQSGLTYENLSRGKDYWADKDDSMLVVRLTESQALAIAKQFETISAQMKTMDKINADSKIDIDESNSSLHIAFMTLKPFSREIFKSLSDWKND